MWLNFMKGSLAGLSLSIAAGCAAPYVDAPMATVVSAPPDLTAPEQQPFAVVLGSPVVPPVLVGTEVEFDLQAQVPGYASVYAFSPDGRVTVLAENRLLAAGQSLHLPDGSDHRFVAGLPAGREHAIAIVSTEPLPGASVIDPPAVIAQVGHRAFLEQLERRLATMPRTSWAGAHVTLDIVSQ